MPVSPQMVTDGLPSSVLVCQNLLDERFDVIVLVGTNIEELPTELQILKDTLLQQKEVDAAYLQNTCVLALPLPDKKHSKRLVFSPTGPINRDHDDVRRWNDAAYAGVGRALQAGASRILLVRQPDQLYEKADEATLMGAFHALYTPLEVREATDRPSTKASSLGFWSKHPDASKTLDYVHKLEKGRIVCRDLGGSDPERTCPLRFAEYVSQTFANSAVKVDIERGKHLLEERYPLLSAVNRGSEEVERFRGCVINLEYKGEGAIEDTVLLVGKGVTYDTGGHDLKCSGFMAGMHRDKVGAAAIAGFFKVVAELLPKNIKILGALGMVRNAIGVNAYVSDEIIVARSGARVRIGNTDAEGRMVMADLICKMKERAFAENNPHIMTWATLTGHARLANGVDYTSMMDNGPAKRRKTAQRLQDAGEEVGDMIEVSNIRREDYDFHKGQSEYEDLLQAASPPSAKLPRGHQGPAAFLVMASGLHKHGIDSSAPLKYTHVDIGNTGPFPGAPTAAPIAAAANFFLRRQ